jgi:hypothetical protein
MVPVVVGGVVRFSCLQASLPGFWEHRVSSLDFSWTVASGLV